MVTWIIGLSGSGKSTLAREVVKKLELQGTKPVYIDGDLFRELFGNDIGYSIEDRRQNSIRISNFCKMLDDQGFLVVCAILSIFPEHRERNRINFSDYLEVFIDTDINSLKERDNKLIYQRYKDGLIKDVAGLDLDFLVPNYDLKITNNSDLKHLLSYSSRICDLMLGKR